MLQFEPRRLQRRRRLRIGRPGVRVERERRAPGDVEAEPAARPRSVRARRGQPRGHSNDRERLRRGRRLGECDRTGDLAEQRRAAERVAKAEPAALAAQDHACGRSRERERLVAGAAEIPAADLRLRPRRRPRTGSRRRPAARTSALRGAAKSSTIAASRRSGRSQCGLSRGPTGIARLPTTMSSTAPVGTSSTRDGCESRTHVAEEEVRRHLRPDRGNVAGPRALGVGRLRTHLVLVRLAEHERWVVVEVCESESAPHDRIEERELERI